MSLECELFERCRLLATDAHRIHLVGVESGYHHMVLDDLYHGVVDKADAIMEAYLGRSAKKIGLQEFPVIKETRNSNPAVAVTVLRTWIDSNRKEMMQHNEVQNLIDELVGFLDSIRYKLLRLS